MRAAIRAARADDREGAPVQVIAQLTGREPAFGGYELAVALVAPANVCSWRAASSSLMHQFLRGTRRIQTGPSLSSFKPPPARGTSDGWRRKLNTDPGVARWFLLAVATLP